ncbi:MAG: SlyX family protein [Halofilum sp. (in: g-proteobacteria)]
MKAEERIDTIEERLMRLQHELEQLDATVQGQAAAHDRLAQRCDQLERRLARFESGDDSGTGG